LLSRLSRLALSAALPFSAILTAQTTPKACPAPPAILKSTQPNIFSEQQEQWLGDAMADMIESQYRPVQDPAENEYLARISKRLLAALPPTTIQFRVILVDSPEVNGFSLAGGRVYLTRKLVANANSEDEVAAVIAHEMGHILSHQFAVETTADLKRLLGVTSVSDKADIYAKFQRIVDASMKDKHPSAGGDTPEKQDEADTVAVFASAAAGYRPQAYAEFWNRMFFVDGKVGGRLSDFFGTTKPESKRLRAILKLVNALPPGCGASESSASTEFQHWQTLVIANQSAAIDASAKPLSEITLTPPLRMDLDRVRFSRDGKYILAQDESSIAVLSRDPFSLLFRFDAERALPAEFSPDSSRIVFHTPGLHTEEWSVLDRKMVASHEPIARHECIQTKLAPDGRTIFCLSMRDEGYGIFADATLLDSATGEVVFQKKNFFLPNLLFLLTLAYWQNSAVPPDILLSSFSADGNFLLIGPGSEKLAFDLRSRTQIPLGKELKNINGVYAFLGSDKIVGVRSPDYKESGIFGFPDGKRLQTFELRLGDLESISSGNYVASQNIDGFAIGLADLSAHKFVLGSKTPTMDVWDGWVISENADGSILMQKLQDSSAPHRSAVVPLSPLGPNLTSAISADDRFLALSTRTRSGVWDLSTGKRLILARRFTSAVFAPDDTLYAEFPKFDKEERGIHHLAFQPLTSALSTKEDEHTYLASGILQEWKSGKKDATLIVHNIADNSILWQRTFAGGEPARTNNLLAGQTILSFPFKTDFAKSRLKAVATLAAQAATIKDKDAGRVIQILDNGNGNILHEVAVGVPLTYYGVAGINVVGDKLYLTSDDNRTMVYDLATGAQLRQFFGFVIALDPATSRICAVNRRDEAIVYDTDGKQLADFYMGSPLRFATFQPNTPTPGSRIILLTADQKIRTMEIPSAAPPTDTATASKLEVTSHIVPAGEAPSQ
jgi:Peptidase family M48